MVKWSKTSPFHGGNPSSNLGRVTKEKTFERMSFSFSYRSWIFHIRTLRVPNSVTRLSRRFQVNLLAPHRPIYPCICLRNFAIARRFPKPSGNAFG